MEKIIDYITGIEVSYKPEEEQAVQPFAKALVEDYGYPKDCIMTHPQFRVKARPSDTKKEYPVDIAVFKDSGKNDDDVYIIDFRLCAFGKGSRFFCRGQFFCC